ncbi:dimethyl sulfoxide reductase anchor subunit family protein [Eggerthella sinensis]|uniref:dimethyl sulfoxide reductase anchor subunit family protein n=1 Tax=Eggerthella sinensis TaxID=242230 RepID=UPI00266C64E7|nr:DmsC/YnfH family molybdoenzyme membrane anchor subunit [Eggerthella sinensis]
MELQWPLILFTTLVAWSAGLFGAQAVAVLRGGGGRAQMPALVASVALLAAGGIAVFFHLQHWERIFNGFGHLTSGITQELIAIVVFVAVAVAYFVMLRKSGDGTVPKWLAVCAVVVALVTSAVCAHSYTMAARPAWDSVLEVLSLVGASCVMGPATYALILAAVRPGDQPAERAADVAAPAGLLALVGALVNAVTATAYAAFLQLSGSSFADVGLYFNPTHPTKAMADAAAAVASQAPLLWVGAVAVGALVPLAAAVLGRRSGNWKLWGTVALAAALIGAVCLRIAFYNLGLSVFMFY